MERRDSRSVIAVPKTRFYSNPFQRFWNGKKAEKPLYIIYLCIKKSLRSNIPIMLLTLCVCLLETQFVYV